jgi:glutamine amidotransferase
MIAVIDLGISNIGSVFRAFQRLGASLSTFHDANEIPKASAIVLPGVGAFGDGMEVLRARNMVAPLRQAARAGTPILGFCLGMQLLADSSEEYGNHEGLGLIPGRVERIKPAIGERVPNIGWCDVEPRVGARLFHDVVKGTPFYFVHSYHLKCTRQEDVAATIAFGGDAVTVAVEHGNIFGLQCHPEKSQDAGLNVLNAFLSLSTQRGHHA